MANERIARIGKPARMGPATADHVWRDIGRQFRARRLALHWSAKDVERNGGPTYKTVLTVERGDTARVELLERHADTLGLTLLDVLRSAVGTASLSHDALAVARAYEQTHPQGQAALLAMARVLTALPPPRTGH